MLTVTIIIAILLILSPFLFGALKEGGHLTKRKSSTFRQFPTLPDDGEE